MYKSNGIELMVARNTDGQIRFKKLAHQFNGFSLLGSAIDQVTEKYKSCLSMNPAPLMLSVAKIVEESAQNTRVTMDVADKINALWLHVSLFGLQGPVLLRNRGGLEHAAIVGTNGN